LLLDVFHDHFVGDGAGAHGVKPTSPEMLPPEFLLEIRMFLEQFSGSFTLDVLGYPAYGDLRRGGNENMDMIQRYVTLEYLDIMSVTDLPDQIPGAVAYFTLEDWLAVFGSPDQMVFQVKGGMGGFSMQLHIPSIPS